MGKNHLVQVAVDATTVERARELAHIAVEAGADIVEAGTPFITYHGVSAINEIVRIAGDRPVLADFKASDGVEKYFMEAGRRGAKYATVLAQAADASVIAAVRGGKVAGVKVVGDLYAIPLDTIGKRAKELEDLGVDYVMIHLGHDDAHANPEKHVLDGLSEVVSATKLPVCVSTFTIEEALEALRLGATVIVQGEPILSMKDAKEKMTEFIRRIKAF